MRPPDLFAVERAGAGPGARLTLVVNDGGSVRCDGGAPRMLASDLLLEARDLARVLQPDAKRHLRLPPGPMSVLSYIVRDADGAVAFSDDSPGAPPGLDRLAFFARRAATGACGLPR